MEEEEIENVVNLISSENEVVKTSLKCALMSSTIKEMQELLTPEGCIDIPIEKVDTATLKRTVKWLEKWQDKQQPTLEEINNKTSDYIDAWDQAFLKEVELPELYELINAANFLGIPGLLWLCTREIAYMIKGKTAEEIRQKFNIANEWSNEELEIIKRENQWCEER